MPREEPRHGVAQVWGPDAITVHTVAAIDLIAGLTLAGRGEDAALRPGLSGMNEGGTSFAGELGPLQAFHVLGHHGPSGLRVPASGHLPASTGPTVAPTPLRALLAEQPI